MMQEVLSATPRAVTGLLLYMKCEVGLEEYFEAGHSEAFIFFTSVPTC